VIGSLNPSPLRAGGGPTPSSKAYATIRQAVGKGGSAENDRGIDGLWRRSQAKGLAAATSSSRRALLQAFPQLATDALPSYERILGLIAAPDASDAQRRAAVVAHWTAHPVRSWNELLAALQALDARFSLALPADSTEIVSDLGRAFEPYDPTNSALGPRFGIPGGCTQLPNYSSRQELRVQFPIGYSGPPNPTDANLIARAEQLLRGALPSDQDFTIAVGNWTLGVTPLGLGALP
jgi:hypothetical protein